MTKERFVVIWKAPAKPKESGACDPNQGDAKRSRSRNHLPQTCNLFLCHPERTRISYLTALTSATCAVLPKENHMQLTEATTLDRKSGEAEGSAVLRTFLGNVFLESAPSWGLWSGQVYP
jgi:hypothetical protein